MQTERVWDHKEREKKKNAAEKMRTQEGRRKEYTNDE